MYAELRCQRHGQICRGDERDAGQEDHVEDAVLSEGGRFSDEGPGRVCRRGSAYRPCSISPSSRASRQAGRPSYAEWCSPLLLGILSLDLLVGSDKVPWLSKLAPGESFTLRPTLRSQGTGPGAWAATGPPRALPGKARRTCKASSTSGGL